MPLTTVPVDAIRVEKWPSEEPLFVFSILVSLLLWIVVVVSIVLAVYAAFIAIFVFVMHVGFIAYVRGSAVRVGPDQFPELHARVSNLSARMGMQKVPETYVMQAGGTLNALATRFFGANFIVLFADLLEACGPNESARDMIIAHELGHIKEGHLHLRWLLLPSYFVPFLAQALSRAREYTCDRYGLAGAGAKEGALLGLSILAAGAKYGPRVNQQALVAQRENLNTGWMAIGEWLATHPPLAKRLAQIEPALLAGRPAKLRAGPARAAAMIAGVAIPMIVATGFVISKIPEWIAQANAANQAGLSDIPTGRVPAMTLSPDSAIALARADLASLAAVLDRRKAAGQRLPVDVEELYELWATANPGKNPPVDPFDGEWYGYVTENGEYRLWATGPDPTISEDNIVVESRRSPAKDR